MNGEQAGVQAGQAGELPVFCLDVRRVLDGVPLLPVRAEFRFEMSSPMLVSVTFTPWRGQAVTWRISRELLYLGLYEESGEGDVQAWPVRGEAGETASWLLLESRTSSAVFELPVAEVEEWLDATYELVPAEVEAHTLDWDAFLGELQDVGERSGD
ncbi:SsgA family sporulation/cell division regulator [Streptomyces sp. NPDC002463]|uniref:SsgA family sporulation/cell division regulator n=1 Tax=Streptomyces sp. NPDC002463 TaxID=3364645 RepID=UPI0036B02030